MFYKKKQKYKYTLSCTVSIDLLNIPSYKHTEIETEFIKLIKGCFIIKAGYSWNGANFIFDTKKNIYPSLIHDCLYQIIEEKFVLYYDFKKEADDLFVEMCRDRGTNKFLCWCYSKALKWFGKNSLKGKLYCE